MQGELCNVIVPVVHPHWWLGTRTYDRVGSRDHACHRHVHACRMFFCFTPGRTMVGMLVAIRGAPRAHADLTSQKSKQSYTDHVTFLPRVQYEYASRYTSKVYVRCACT